MTCDKCGCESPQGLYENSGEPGQFLCLNCMPAEIVNQYPGWREREAIHMRRREQAMINFTKGRNL